MALTNAIDAKFWRCVHFLAIKDFAQIRREDPRAEFWETESKLDNDLEFRQKLEPTDAPALRQGTEDILRRDCQLLLLSGIVAIEDCDVWSLLSDLRNVLRHLALPSNNNGELFDKCCRAAYELSDDGFWQCEISVRAARYFVNLGALEKARWWIDRLPHEVAPVFRDPVASLRHQLDG